MTNVNLTDLTIKRLKWNGKQTTYWDKGLRGFGCRVGKYKKTLVVMVGKERKLITVGHYPDDKLRDVRLEAKRVMSQIHKPTVDSESLKKEYLEEAENRLAEKTYIEYQAYLDSFDFEVSSLTLKEVKTYLAQYDGKPTAQNYAHASLRAFLNWCIREGAIEHHPLIRRPLPNRVQSRDRVLTDDELKAIWNHTDYHPFGHIVRCLMLSGQRRLEIAHAQPDQITEVFTIPQTKNREPHIIPLTPLLAEYLKPPFPFNGWSKSKTKLDEKCGVKDWKLHDLRRTWATVCARSQVEPHVIERVLNHQSGSIAGVAKIYNRYGYLNEMEKALVTFEKHLTSIITAKRT